MAVAVAAPLSPASSNAQLLSLFFRELIQTSMVKARAVGKLVAARGEALDNVQGVLGSTDREGGSAAVHECSARDCGSLPISRRSAPRFCADLPDRIAGVLAAVFLERLDLVFDRSLVVLLAAATYMTVGRAGLCADALVSLAKLDSKRLVDNVNPGPTRVKFSSKIVGCLYDPALAVVSVCIIRRCPRRPSCSQIKLLEMHIPFKTVCELCVAAGGEDSREHLREVSERVPSPSRRPESLRRG